MNRVSIVIVFVFVVKTLGRTAWTVEDIRPMNFVNSKTVVWGWERRFWHFKITFSIFSSVSAKVMVQVSIFRPKNSYLLWWFQDWFFQIYDNTQMLKQKNQVSRLIKISSVLPIRRISSRYIARRKFSHLSTAIGTFNSFENILGAGPNPKQRQGTRKDFLTNLTNFRELMHSGTEN